MDIWRILNRNDVFALAALIAHGGDGGVRHAIEHFGPALESWWADLGCKPKISDAAAEKVIAGVTAEAAGRSLDDLTRERDHLLISLLEMLARERGKS